MLYKRCYEEKSIVSVQYCAGFPQAQGVLLQSISAPSSVNLWVVAAEKAAAGFERINWIEID